jgi:hypothetical protein
MNIECPLLENKKRRILKKFNRQTPVCRHNEIYNTCKIEKMIIIIGSSIKFQVNQLSYALNRLAIVVSCQIIFITDSKLNFLKASLYFFKCEESFQNAI